MLNLASSDLNLCQKFLLPEDNQVICCLLVSARRLSVMQSYQPAGEISCQESWKHPQMLSKSLRSWVGGVSRFLKGELWLRITDLHYIPPPPDWNFSGRTLTLDLGPSNPFPKKLERLMENSENNAETLLHHRFNSNRRYNHLNLSLSVPWLYMKISQYSFSYC